LELYTGIYPPSRESTGTAGGLVMGGTLGKEALWRETAGGGLEIWEPSQVQLEREWRY